MKKTKVIIPALGILLLSTAASVTGTVAWFSANSTVTATGMEVKAKAESALVIGTELPVGTATTVALDAQDDDESLVPATHNTAVDTGSVTLSGTDAVSGLKYNSNPAVVDAATGLERTDETLTLADVPAARVGEFAYDYYVYIAAAGQAKTLAANEELKARINVSSTIYGNLGDTNGAYDTWNALSVDFYVLQDSTSVGTYKGTLNLKKSNLTASGDIAESAEPIDLLAAGETIPVNKQSDDYLRVLMRVYFDGALLKEEGQAYVYSNIINTNGIAFGASFKIE